MFVKTKKFIEDHKDQIAAFAGGALIAGYGAAMIKSSIRKQNEIATKERQTILTMVTDASSANK